MLSLWCLNSFARYRRCPTYELLIEFRERRREAEQLYSRLFSSFIYDSLSACKSVIEKWRLFDRFGLLKSGKSAASYLDCDEFAKFLLVLPGCDDPIPDLRALVDY